MNELKNIPSVSRLFEDEQIKKLLAEFGNELLTFVSRLELTKIRTNVLAGKKIPADGIIIKSIASAVNQLTGMSFKRVINATGIILHTNLGRAPLGKELLEEVHDVISGYSNLEFDLKKGKRGSRYEHISSIISYLTSADDAIVVNNNASSLTLILNTFAIGKEVIISRGELIEIGGSFRLPDIMNASGCKLVEVGTTNKTRIEDYENAITENTGLIFKIHKSNYALTGFTEEASISSLSKLCQSKNIPFVYDLGSGILRKTQILEKFNEPDVQSSLKEGADLVAFSCDKLLGGPQGGIIAGNAKYLQQLRKSPLLRSLRISKLDLAVLSVVCRCYLDDQRMKKIPTISMLTRSADVMKSMAEKLQKLLKTQNVESEIAASIGCCGGGTLPDFEIPGYALKFIAPKGNSKEQEKFAETIYKKLLVHKTPIVGVLKEGAFFLNMHSLFEDELECIAKVF